ncbi:MAG: hypothetical protein ACLFPF_03840 [Halanaerobiales bacterium]
MYRKSIFLIITLALLTIIFSLPVVAVGVSPLVLDFDLRPGDSSEFELQLRPGETRETVKFTLFHPIQKMNGDFTYIEGDPSVHPAISWVTLEKEQAVVIPGGENLLKGSVNVPYGAEGTHSVIIMVEQVDNEDGTQPLLTFKVRYAVRLNINVDTPGQRVEAELIDFGLESDENGAPILYTNFKNSSYIHYFASAEATVRDTNRHLIERVLLISEAAERAERQATRIYPGSEVKFTGDITEPLFPGTYELQLTLNYADDRKIIERRTVDIGDEFVKSENIRFLSISPDIISRELRPGAAVTQVIEVKNNSDKEVQVNLAKRDIKPEYQYSLFSTGEFQLRGENSFTLEPRSSKRIVLIYRSTRDAESAGYYGQLEMEVLAKDGEYIETNIVDLQMVIGEGHEYSTEVRELAYQGEGDDKVVSVNLKNSGSVHIIPEGEISLKNSNGEMVRNLDLQMKEGPEYILPGTTGTLLTSSLNLEPGEYTAEIIIRNQGEEVETVEIKLNIQ